MSKAAHAHWSAEGLHFKCFSFAGGTRPGGVAQYLYNVTLVLGDCGLEQHSTVIQEINAWLK